MPTTGGVPVFIFLPGFSLKVCFAIPMSRSFYCPSVCIRNPSNFRVIRVFRKLIIDRQERYLTNMKHIFSTKCIHLLSFIKIFHIYGVKKVSLLVHHRISNR